MLGRMEGNKKVMVNNKNILLSFISLEFYVGVDPMKTLYCLRVDFYVN